MNSRERVLAAIERRDLDRVPIDLGGTAVTTILAEAYDKLLKKLGIHKPIRIADTQQFFVHVDDEIAELFQTDVVPLYGLRDFDGVRRDKGWKDWKTPHDGTPVKVSADFRPEILEDGSYQWEVGGYVYRMPSDGYFFDYVKSPLEDAETVADIEAFHIPVMDDEEKDWFGKEAARLGDSHKFVVADIVGGWTDIAGPLMGNANFYMAMAANKSLVHALMAKLNDVWKQRVDILAEVAGNSIDAIIMYSDLGAEKGGLYATATVKELVIPYIRDFYDHVHKVSDFYVLFHSCGSIYQYIPDLIDAGVDLLNPVQVGAANMDPEKLQREFGKHIVFWGGAVDPQHVLYPGSPADVEAYAKRCTEAFKQDGGFVFSQPHNIQPGVPPENVIALYQAGITYGQY